MSSPLSPRPWRNSLLAWVCSLRLRCVGDVKVAKVLGLQNQRRSNWSSRTRTVASAFDNHRHCELWPLERSDAEKPTINTRMLVVHDGFFILTNDVALVVFLNSMPR